MPNDKPRPTVDVGTIDLYDFMALVNAATLGATAVLQVDDDTITRIADQCRNALDNIGADRWNALMHRLAKAGGDVIAKQGITNVRPVIDEMAPDDPRRRWQRRKDTQ